MPTAICTGNDMVAAKVATIATRELGEVRQIEEMLSTLMAVYPA